MILKKLSLLVKNQLRIVPEIQFFIDDSLDYIEGVETAISKGKKSFKTIKLKASSFLAIKYLFSKTKFNIVSIISVFSITVLTLAYFLFLQSYQSFQG